VSSASFEGVENERRRTRSREEEDRKVFGRLVKYLGEAKWAEQDVTMLEKRAKCPFRTLTFDGVTQVVCDFSGCRDLALCPGNCRQAFAYLDPSTLQVTSEEPEGEYRKVYIGCIYEDKAGIESTKPFKFS
jgi:hypothetical protein